MCVMSNTFFVFFHLHVSKGQYHSRLDEGRQGEEGEAKRGIFVTMYRAVSRFVPYAVMEGVLK
ncbi:unnamed protein product [Taenia asiatica]|uniref:Secreted protein n=1 Tax=Taenia asiatica TaxID=60517 RepID=A0A0R3W4Y1_TAEAS|nr:unnamed protein product [Taenia asiatica]